MNLRNESLSKIVALVSVVACLWSVRVEAALPSFKRVVVVIFENANYADALAQPYFKKLAGSGALFTNFLAETHPSQPNYLALISGDTLGVTNDNPVNLDGKHLGNLLEAKSLNWKAYAENLPSACFLGKVQGRYVRKHVPFYSFTNVQSSPSECGKVVEGAQFFRDASSGSLPAFSLYVPNLDNDGHDTGAAFASNWFSGAFGNLLADPNFLKDTLVVVTFDESKTFLGPNQVYTVLLGANVSPGVQVSAQTNHYQLLRTIEDQFSLGNLGRKDATTTGISGIWR
jgi:hypothetical protein